MTFLKVLKAADVGLPGPLAFGGKFFDLPEFLCHSHTIFNRKVLQGDDAAVLPELFWIFPEPRGQFPPASYANAAKVLACEKFLKGS